MGNCLPDLKTAGFTLSLHTMRTFYTGILSLLSLLWLAGCATSSSIDYDQAAKAKMAAYKTYSIDPREAREAADSVVLSPIVDRRIEAAISKQLNDKDYEAVDSNPDFRVTFQVATRTRQSIQRVDYEPFPRYHYRHFHYRFPSYSEYAVREYEEGTFIIDLIDNASSELVWRGVYVKSLGWSSPDAAAVDEIVAETLGQFPPE